MKRLKLLLILILGFGLTAWTFVKSKGTSIQSQHVTGKWVGTLSSQGATFPLSYDLKVDRNKLTGTGLSPGGVFELTSCVIKDNDFSFEMLVGSENVKHTCKYYPVGDSVSMDIFFDGNNLHSKLLRDK